LTTFAESNAFSQTGIAKLEAAFTPIFDHFDLDTAGAIDYISEW